MEERPARSCSGRRSLRSRLLGTASSAREETAEGAPLQGAPPRPGPLLACGRRRALPPDLLRAEGRSGVPEEARARGRGSPARAQGRLCGRLAPEDACRRRASCASSSSRSGIITAEGRELLGGCIVVPIPDPATGQWTNLYGRGMKTPRHCYLPGPLRGVLNFQAARLSSEVVLTESILDAL